MSKQKLGNKPALMMRSCDNVPVSDQQRIACGLHIASRGLAAALASAVEPFGLSGMEANFLSKLEFGLNSPSEIATYLGVDASNLSRLMRRLEKEELIIRAVDESNRSRVIIDLTNKGKRLAQKLKPAIREMENTVMSALSEGELKTLQRVLKKLCVSLMD